MNVNRQRDRMEQVKPAGIICILIHVRQLLRLASVLLSQQFSSSKQPGMTGIKVMDR